MLKNLRKLREETGTTQKQLADAINVSQQSINKYENHNIEPDIDTLICIADYFDVSVDYLVGHSSIKHVAHERENHLLTKEETELIKKYRSLNCKEKACIKIVIESYNK